MSPVPYTWAHFWPKFFSKSTKLKLDPLPPPRIISIHYLYWLLTRVYRKVGKSGLFAFLGSARAAVGSFRKIGQFFDHLNFEKYEPGSLYVGPFLAKIFLKIDEIKIRPLTPPQNHFNTLPVLVADACIQEGWEKVAYLHFWAPPVQRWGHFGKLDNFLTT